MGANIAGRRTLPEWLAAIERMHPDAVALGLARADSVRRRLGLDLAAQMPIITVGGTNGKGSVCAMLQAILAAAGYRVGCYTSPHLFAFNERIRVDGEALSDAAICESFAAVEAARGGTALTYFEFATLAAAAAFARAGADAAILEVGMGGRLDAVNIFEPAAAAVVTVAVEHSRYLGRTREKIGYEKAGIFRQGIAAVCGEKQPPDSLIRHAEAIGADLRIAGRDFDFAAADADSPMPPSRWDYQGARVTLRNLPAPALRGRHQLQNAACALALLESLADKLWAGAGAIRRGLHSAAVAARFETTAGRPVTVLDVAHNPAAARALAAALADGGFYPQTAAICGVMADKDYPAMIRALRARTDCWFAVAPPVAGALPAADLAAEVGRQGGRATACATMADAIAGARARCESSDRIVVFGSFHTIAAYRDAISDRKHAIAG